MIQEVHTLKLGLVQCAMEPDISKNFKKIQKLVENCADREAKLVCLPELFAYPYFASKEEQAHFDLAEEIPGKISEFLRNLAKNTQVNLIGGSLFEVDKTNSMIYYNTSLIINSEGEILTKYRKIHIPQDPNYYERFYFSPGNLGYQLVKIDEVNISVLICYDQWFPEPARILALRGVQLICYPTAIGWFPQLHQTEPFSASRWERAMTAHASMNGIYVAGCNRVGMEGKMKFWGGSFIADPYGQIISKASNNQEEIIFAEINTDLVRESQEGWGFLKYRRPDTYHDLIAEMDQNETKKLN